MIPIQPKTDLTPASSAVKSITPVSSIAAIPDSQNSQNFFIENQKYHAIIEGRLTNGNFQVLIDGKLFQMTLPENFQSGNKLELVYITKKPEPQFLILNQLTQYPTDTAEADAVISPTGRFLGLLMQDTFKNPDIIAQNNHTDIHSKSISTSHPVINSSELPALLQKTIIQSGLFYESHQAQWIEGKSTIENLRLEPQGKLLPTAPEITTSKSVLPALMSSDAPVHNQVIPLVQQQLSALETGHLFWRGEIWQGQVMNWDIYEESEQGKQENDEPQYASHWRTQIRLSLPQLGNITATIAFNAQGIHIELNTSQMETAHLLRENQTPLAADMQSAGIAVRLLDIQCNANQ